RFQLLGDYLSSPFDAFDSGGTLDIDLQAAVDNSDSTVESGTIRIELNLSNGTTASADIKVRLRDAKAAPPPVPIAPLIVHVMPEQRYEQVVSASPIPPVQPDSGTALILPSAPEPGMPAPADGVATRPNEPIEPVAPVALTTPDSTPSTAAPTVSVRVEPAALRVPVGGFEFKLADVITYAIAGAGVVLAVLLVVLYRVTLRRRDAKEMAFELSPDAEPGQVFAYLKALDGREDRHPINSAAYRIGRHGDNELPIQDPSMSRHHAQIQRKRDGSFVITDLDSMNGVFVNDKRITRSPLNDGDRVELGDVQMRFAAAVQDELDGDDTMMVTTAMPSAYQMDRGAA
ncbi:MAG: FHA domain-containing protein, partial [Chromatiales bacterium]|nr:FHA domain-containing protein [Chromatiales bacterium]